MIVKIPSNELCGVKTFALSKGFTVGHKKRMFEGVSVGNINIIFDIVKEIVVLDPSGVPLEDVTLPDFELILLRVLQLSGYESIPYKIQCACGFKQLDGEEDVIQIPLNTPDTVVMVDVLDDLPAIEIDSDIGPLTLRMPKVSEVLKIYSPVVAAAIAGHDFEPKEAVGILWDLMPLCLQDKNGKKVPPALLEDLPVNVSRSLEALVYRLTINNPPKIMHKYKCGGCGKVHDITFPFPLFEIVRCL